MNHLSGLDATFLHLVCPEMPMHMGSLCILDLPEGYNSDDFYDAAKQRVAERMHLAELFTRKLALSTKVHHAGMDGQGGIAVAQAIFDLKPTGRVVKPPRCGTLWHPRQKAPANAAGASPKT